jgi:hypothetical protein
LLKKLQSLSLCCHSVCIYYISHQVGLLCTRILHLRSRINIMLLFSRVLLYNLVQQPYTPFLQNKQNSWSVNYSQICASRWLYCSNIESLYLTCVRLLIIIFLGTLTRCPPMFSYTTYKYSNISLPITHIHSLTHTFTHSHPHTLTPSIWLLNCITIATNMVSFYPKKWLHGSVILND